MSKTTPQALIDLRALQANYALLRQKAPGAETAAVVKANGYGLGIAAIGTALYQAGCRTFFTAHFNEALTLRAALADGQIAVLHGLHPTEFAEAAARNITPVIPSLLALAEWSDFCRTQDRPLPTIIHLDTGMSRLGLGDDELERLLAAPDLLAPLRLDYWLSHFCSSEEPENPLNAAQAKRFSAALKRLPKAKASLSNSSGIFLGRDYHFDLSRPGAALYGINPTPAMPNPMQPVVTLQAPILQVRTVKAGDTVGYNQTFRFDHHGKVATIAMGYADGYLRSLHNIGMVRIGEYDVPIIARISMDLITLDVTDIPDRVAHPGALAILIGPHRNVDQIAMEAGTNAYEILTRLGARVQRVYLNE